MSKFLVTGADGFIGSHLVELLLQKGHAVRALALYNSFGDFGWLKNLEKNRNLEVILGDIRDFQNCQDLVQGVDGVFHLAALIGIPYSYQSVNSYIQTNILGTSNICQALTQENQVPIISMSTSEVYGTAQEVPIKETHRLHAQSPYSATKIGADAIAAAYHHAFDLPLTIARPFNTYGPRQSRRAFIPSVISQIVGGCEEIAVGDVNTTRDLTFVLDTVQSLLLLMEKSNHAGEVVNIGTNNEYSIEQVISIIQEILSTDLPLKIETSRLRPSGSEVLRLVCDNSKLKSIVGLVPTTDIREGLVSTINWIKLHKHDVMYAEQNYAI